MRGTRLGRYGADVLAPANKAAAIEHAEQLQPIFAELRGLSANAIARELRKRKVPTARGGKWIGHASDQCTAAARDGRLKVASQLPTPAICGRPCPAVGRSSHPLPEIR